MACACRCCWQRATSTRRKRLIDRGVAADRTLGLRGAPPAHAYFLTTDDAARNVRARLYPPAGLLRRAGVEVQVEPAAAVERPRAGAAGA